MTMREISKVSDITAADLAEYLRIADPDASDTQLLNNLFGAAKAFMTGYTGQTDLDLYQDFVIAALILVQDMWDNRALYVDKGEMNEVVERILDLHSVNLI